MHTGVIPVAANHILIKSLGSMAMPKTAQAIEHEVKSVLETGEDIYERIKAITLKALTEQELDQENIQKVVEAVFKGISTGMDKQFAPAQKAFSESVSAIDDVLEMTIQASKLAIEEAAAHVDEFSGQDLHKAAEDIKGLEEMFLDTLKQVTHTSSDTFMSVAHDFISHARQNGTAIGRQSEAALGALDELRVKGQGLAWTGAKVTVGIISNIARGILSGIAESIDSPKPKP
jgi:hypothetical protein